MAKKGCAARTGRRTSSSATEVEAYEYVRRQLRNLGWKVKNPSLGTGGQVWTQNQCFDHPEIKQALGRTRPENIVKVSEELLWVIEAKSTRKEADRAIREATHDYSDRINKAKKRVRAILASGVAGNDEAGYLVRTMIRDGHKWRDVTINGKTATGLLSPEDVDTLLRGGGPDIREFAPSQRVFLPAAERINEELHLGGINKNDRAKTMAGLLLSVVGQPPNLDTNLLVLIREINARSEDVLKANQKPEFAPFVEILAPTNRTNHVKFKQALVRTIQELRDSIFNRP